MNENIRLEPYSQIQHGGIASLVVDQGPLGVTVTREADGKIAFDELTYDEINDGLRTGHIVVQDGYHSEEAARQRTKFGEQVVTQLPRKQREKVFFGQTWCDFFLDAEARGEIGRNWRDVDAWILKVAPQIAKHIPQPEGPAQKRKYCGKKRSRNEIDSPSSSTLLRWVRKYQDAGRSVLALIDKRYLAGRTKVKFGPESAALDLSRFDAAPLIAFTATKEMNYGTETDGRISPGCGADSTDQWA
ncbi:hypothetical protein ACFP4H_17740, partial [Pseudophaeobacter arcticus]